MKRGVRELSGHVAKRPHDTLPSLEVRLFGVTRREAAGYLAGAIALAVLLSAAGAFDSDEIAFAHRLALWTVFAVLSVAQTLMIDGLLAPRLPPGSWGRAAAGVLTVIGVIALMTIELHLLKFTPLLPYEPDPLVQFALFIAPPVGAIAGIVVMTRVLAPEGIGSRSARPEPRQEPAQVSFQTVIAGYLPAPSTVADWPREPVLRVRAHDHYLEVFTRSDRTFLRGRMTDALRALAGADGVRPHRSWWIARSEVAEIRRVGRDYELETRDGLKIPVARSRVSDLRARGLL